MGLSPRLEKMYSAVVPSAELPVIVRASKPVDSGVLAGARGAGVTVRYVSRIGNAYGGTATLAAARRAAALPETVEVSPDEPVGLVGRS